MDGSVWADDAAWFRDTRFGSGVARAIVERIHGSGGGCQCWHLDYQRMAREFEFTEKQLRAAVGRLVAHSFARVVEAGDCYRGPTLELLTPSRVAQEEAALAAAQAKEAERAAKIAARGGRVSRAPIPDVVKARVYARDNFTCVKCGATADLTLDHIHPWSVGGPDTEDNLRVLCRSCNSRKGDRTS